jgi:hypothetical protein
LLISGSQENLSVNASKFCYKRYRELLIAAIIKHELPFSFVEYDGIREMIRYYHRNAPLISRNTAKADLVKMYLLEKQKVKSLLNVCLVRISLISDIWTSLKTDGYICLTAHFIDKDWVLHKRVLSFSFLPPPHSSTSLAEKIDDLLQEWGIDKKIFSLTLDWEKVNNIISF